MINQEKVLLEDLKTLGAKSELIDWFDANKLNGLPVENLLNSECGWGPEYYHMQWLWSRYLTKDQIHPNETSDWSRCTLDDNDNVVREDHADGRWATYEYDDDNRCTRYEDSQGHWYTNSYDDQGRLVYYNNKDGDVTAYEHIGNTTTCYIRNKFYWREDYNEDGLIVERNFKDHPVERRTYEDGKLVRVDHGDDRWTVYDHDDQGRVIAEYYWNETGVSTEYDENGNECKTITVVKDLMHTEHTHYHGRELRNGVMCYVWKHNDIDALVIPLEGLENE